MFSYPMLSRGDAGDVDAIRTTLGSTCSTWLIKPGKYSEGGIAKSVKPSSSLFRQLK